MTKTEKQITSIMRELNNSDIMKEEKEIWSEFIPGMEEDDITTLAAIIEKNPEKIGFLTQNLENKIRAVASGNEEELIRIVESEKALLTKK